MSRNAILIYLSVLFFLKFYNVKSSQPLKGPYRTIPVTIRNCTEKEVVHPHTSFGQFLQWHAETYNSSRKTLIRANYTVLKSIETAKGKIRSFFWEDNQWKLRMIIPGFSCLRTFVRYLIQILKININNQCTITEDTRTLNRLDYDGLHQAWEPETEYGRWIWTYEITSRAKSVHCMAVESVAVPRR